MYHSRKAGTAILDAMCKKRKCHTSGGRGWGKKIVCSIYVYASILLSDIKKLNGLVRVLEYLRHQLVITI